MTDKIIINVKIFIFYITDWIILSIMCIIYYNN